MHTLITLKNCRIENSKGTIISQINWEMKQGEAWLVIGPNGGGKADFINALANYSGLKFVPNQTALNDSLLSSVFGTSVDIVSLERAARLIQEERENDESDYVEGGVDIGRTGRVFITESLCGNISKNAALPPVAYTIDERPEVKLCGIQKILDRGLKYMSTGEIRRTLLARALISGKKLLILSDPFAGLDAESRSILLKFFENYPSLILGMERWHEIPDAIICGNDAVADSVISALDLYYPEKHIPICGQDADIVACQNIVNGKQDFTVYKPIIELAEKAAEFAVELAKGKSVEELIERNETINNGFENVPVYWLEPKLVTKKNLDSVIIDSGFHTRSEVYKEN